MYSLARVVGHRGLAAVAPENTLAGLRAARDAGLRFVEVDILPSADGAAVLSHDDSLERRGGPAAKVTDTPLAELRRIPVGRGFAGHEDAGIPTAREALAFCAGADLGMVLELKPEGGREGALALAADLDAARTDGRMPEHLMISSFAPDMLHWARELNPDIPRALNIWDLEKDWQGPARDAGCANLHAHWRTASPRLARETAARRMGLYCYTVNSPELFSLLRGMGVDGVFTDSPQVAVMI